MKFLKRETFFFLQVFFSRPVLATSVLLYVATDAMFELEIEPASVTIQLIDTQNQTHNFEQNTLNVNCEATPIVISVITDLSKPFFYTRGKTQVENELRMLRLFH